MVTYTKADGVVSRMVEEQTIGTPIEPIKVRYFIALDAPYFKIDKVISYDCCSEKDCVEKPVSVYEDFPNAIEITNEQHDEIVKILRAEFEFVKSILPSQERPTEELKQEVIELLKQSINKESN